VNKKTLIMTRIVEGVGHKLYMDNFFSSPDLFNDLAQKKIYGCGTERLHRQGMPKDLKGNAQGPKSQHPETETG
jgi:hypothetical protein